MKIDSVLPLPSDPGRFGYGQACGRLFLALSLTWAGLAHLTVQRLEFQAQVPPWLPFDPDLVVVLSGLVEIALGLALFWPWAARRRALLGWMVAAFFVAIFPGNIAQLVERRDAFGLDTDLKRWLRLPFQPVLIFLALWSTGAWQAWRATRARSQPPLK